MSWKSHFRNIAKSHISESIKSDDECNKLTPVINQSSGKNHFAFTFCIFILICFVVCITRLTDSDHFSDVCLSVCLFVNVLTFLSVWQKWHVHIPWNISYIVEWQCFVLRKKWTGNAIKEFLTPLFFFSTPIPPTSLPGIKLLDGAYCCGSACLSVCKF